MKPFYRVLTYLVLIVQSFIILLLLPEKQKDDCPYTAGSSVANAGHKAVPVHKDDRRREITALSGELLLFRFYHCKR